MMRSITTLAAVLAAVGLGAMRADAGRAAPSPHWTVVPAATPAASQEPGLFGVSCRSATGCIAVGSFARRGAGRMPLAERWNGTRWSIEAAPRPAGSPTALLRSVSCPSSTRCVGVGYTETRAGSTLPLAERWDGHRWTVLTVPGAGRYSQLESVSCPTATTCLAVGTRTGAGVTAALAERWDGIRWTIDPTPRPLNHALYSISCAAPRSCEAVGTAVERGRSVPLAEAWNGRRWNAQAAAVPAGETASALTAVSCPSRAGCTAVGGMTTGPGGHMPLAERWNGHRWTRQRIPAPRGAPPTYLTSVSCATQAICTAVGYALPHQESRPLVERWATGRWSIQTGPVLTDMPVAQLHGVFCSGRYACAAVGSSATSAERGAVLALRYG